MGVEGLVELLQRIQVPSHVTSFRTIGFDGHHLVQDGVEAVGERVKGITKYGVRVIIVFDGECGAGSKSCERCMVTPSIIKAVQEMVSCLVIVAQFAYMLGTGIVDVVITEDTNFFLFGCSKIMFGLEEDGRGSTIDLGDLPMVTSPLDLSTFSPKKFWEWCVLSGASDHWAMPSGLEYSCPDVFGLVNSYRYIRKFDGMSACVESMKGNPLFIVSEGYMENVVKCWSYFVNQSICYIHDKLGKSYTNLCFLCKVYTLMMVCRC